MIVFSTLISTLLLHSPYYRYFIYGTKFTNFTLNCSAVAEGNITGNVVFNDREKRLFEVIFNGIPLSKNQGNFLNVVQKRLTLWSSPWDDD
jgi:hypothetical protein